MKLGSRSGFTLVEGLLLIMAVGIIGFTGWYVWSSKSKTESSYNNSVHSSSNAPKTSAIKSFEDCKAAAGSKMLETYPEQCVSKDGKRYTNPGQDTSGICQDGAGGPCNNQ